MSKFEKGNSGKPKGAINKTTQASRELFLETLEGQSEHIAAAFEKVRKDNPRAYLDLFAKYAQYFVPKKTENSDTVKHEFVEFDIKKALEFVKTKQ
jgi:hypothetical protein